VQYCEKTGGPEIALLKESLEPTVQNLGMALIELHVFRTKARKGSLPGAQVRVIVYKPGLAGKPSSMGTDDCSRVHRAIVPQLEQAFPGHDFSVEVSTPGITRQVRDGAELAHYRGRGVRLWRTDISDWSAGIVENAGEQGVTIQGKEGTIRLDYEIIAKARLDPSQEEYIGH
jgi:ribosome maturation factor RimP